MDQRAQSPGGSKISGNYESDYHDRQFREPYRSTVAFCDWLEAEGFLTPESTARVLDLGSGAGANIYHMSKRYPRASFVGIDFNPDLVEKGNEFFRRREVENCRLEVGDIYSLDPSLAGAFDGVVSLQTLSWLPDFREPLAAITKLGPQWIAVTSLFYDGPVSCTIELTQYDNDLTPNWSGFYNVYSLPIVRRFMHDTGYDNFRFTPFEIDIDLPRPSNGLMSTYTEKLERGRRLQRSGPLLMPWYFMAATR